MQTKTISYYNQKILAKEENKIKYLENRLNSPNNVGKAPAEYIPLKDTEIQNIKTQMIILPPTKIFANFANRKKLSPLKRKKTVTEVKIEMFLNKKRQSSAPKEIKDEGNKNSNVNGNINNSNLSRFSEKSSNIKNIKGENNSSLFSAKNISNNNNLFNSKNDIKNKFEFKLNKKNANKQNSHNFNEYLNNKNINNSLKSKTIYDYYKTTSIKSSDTNKEDSQKLIKNKNALLNKEIDIININNNENYEKLLKTLEEQNLILEKKEKEISELKLSQKENQEIIFELKKCQKDSETEIKRCRLDISNMVKEISNLKRESKKKWLNDQQYKIGKISTAHSLHYNKNHTFEYWEDGKDISEIKNKLEKIKIQKKEIEKEKNGKLNSNENLNIFKLNLLEKEENELIKSLKEIEKNKFLYIREQNLFNQENCCTFAPQKKEGLPLLSGRYQIIGLLGKGGYSEVYKAYDLENHIYVACKLNQLNDNWKEEIKNNYIKHTIRENQIHKNIDHPRIVKLFDTIEIDNDSFCTILEHCTGPDLSTYIKKNKYIPEKDAKIIISQILEGLLYLNNLPNKIIHYDLKPENIIFNNMEIKISDFGLSKIIETNSDKVQLTSQGVGTYWYLPPECFEEKKNINISSKVDIWSCGIILYEMIYGKKPFGHNCSQDKLIKDKIMQNAKNVVFPDEPIISEECKDFIKHCLAYKQEDRYDIFQAMKSNFIQMNN